MPSRHCLDVGGRATNGSRGADIPLGVPGSSYCDVCTDRSGQIATMFTNIAV